MGMRQEDEWAYRLQSQIDSTFAALGFTREDGAYTNTGLTQRFRIESGQRSSSVVGEPSIVMECKGESGQWTSSGISMKASDFVSSEAPFGLSRPAAVA